jgi:hypothetical protein
VCTSRRKGLNLPLWPRAQKDRKCDSLVRMTLWGYNTFSRSCWRDLEGGLPASGPGGEIPKADVEGDEEMIWGWEKELEIGRGGELLLCGIGTAAVRDVGGPGGDWDWDVIASSCWRERN